MKNKGFTLVELMIVIAIIALLAAVALPKFASATEAAKVANVQGNLANLRTSLAVYYAKNKAYPVLGHGGIAITGNVGLEFQNFYSNTQLPLVPSGDNVTVARRSVINGANGAPNTGVGGWKYDATKGDIRANLPSASGSPKTGGAYGENTIDWELE